MSQAYHSGLLTDVVRSMWYGALVRMVRLRVDTWIRGSASEPLDQLVNVVGGVTERSRSDVSVASGGENDRGSVKRRQDASADFVVLQNLLLPVGALRTIQSLRTARTLRQVSLVRRIPLQSAHMSISPPSSHSLHDANAVPTAPHVSTHCVPGRADQGRSGRHRSADGRRSVHRARKSPERIACEPIQQALQSRRVRPSECDPSV